MPDESDRSIHVTMTPSEAEAVLAALTVAWEGLEETHEMFSGIESVRARLTVLVEAKA